jgi:hypothetical protein
MYYDHTVNYPVLAIKDSGGSTSCYWGATASAIQLVSFFADRDYRTYMYLNGAYMGVVDTSARTNTIAGSALLIGAGNNLTEFSGDILYAAVWDLGGAVFPGSATNATVMGAIVADRFATVCGGQCTKSTPLSFTRASAAYLDRCVAAPVRTMFPVSQGWPRVCQRKGSTGQEEYGILCEPQCTNELLYSEDFSHATWAKTRAAIGSNAAVAPDGNTTADAIIASADANTHCIDQDCAAADAEHIFSVWAKIGASNWMELSAPSVANAYAYYNLAGGLVGTVGAGANSTGIEDWGNGWYRCWIAYTGGSAAHTHRICPAEADNDDNFTGDASTPNIYVWGAQHEDDGTVIPSSYIKTTTAAATRIKDSLVRTVSGMTTGKITLSARCLLGPSHNNTQVKTIAMVDDASANNSLALTVTAADVPNLKVVAATSTTADITGDDNVTDGKWHDIKAKAVTNLVSQSVDGAVDGSDDTSAAIPSGLTALRIGCTGTGLTLQPLGLIREIKLQKDVI